MRLSGAEVERLLDTWPVARLATLGPDGRPHLVPIVFVRHAGALWSPIDGKPKRSAELARVRNLAHDPRACLLLDHYDADWRRLWWIRVDGRAAVVGRDPEAEAALRAKYPPYREGGTALYAGAPALIRIEIARVTSWAAVELPSPRP
jgi:PPOX class probable F420-dependent enzyme